ncbi:gephyrin-like molybdotransferase Glp [Roseovarius sp. 2305UL8-3]|uniref:molybdopterin molybdotransferase MoeA n=1 Tax=Roseovarius conchicola TaxID=3121636 RepID=UPI003529568C
MLDQIIPPACDCDDPHGTESLLEIETAISLALSLVSEFDKAETIPLMTSIGRVCAKDRLATCEMPFFDNSAMDGFAVRCQDFTDKPALPICGTVAAGQAPGPLAPGTAMRIFTGAPVPAGADAVIKVEDCVETDEGVTFRCAPPRQGQNIRTRGSDQQQGACLLRKGQRIAARHLGLLAAQGIQDIGVACRPRVAVASTGHELGPMADGAARIHDANRPMLMALVAAMGAEVIDLGVIPDEAGATAKALARAVGACDLILTSGAVSMGGKDHMRAAVTNAGGQIDGWRVAVKPGKPVMFGHLGPTAITGLPGNPFAAFVGFHLFAAPQIVRLMGADHRPALSTPAQAGFDWSRKPGRAEVFPVRLLGYSGAGVPQLDRLGESVSATLFPLSGADGIALVGRETAQVAPGDALLWHPFADRGGVL